MSREPLLEYGQAMGSRRHPGVTMSLRKQGPGMVLYLRFGDDVVEAVGWKPGDWVRVQRGSLADAGMLRLSPGEPRGISCRQLMCAKKGGLPFVRIVGRAAGLEKAPAYRGNLKWVVPEGEKTLVVCLPPEVTGLKCEKRAF